MQAQVAREARAAVVIQSRWRGELAKASLRRRVACAVQLQAWVRGYVVRVFIKGGVGV